MVGEGLQEMQRLQERDSEALEKDYWGRAMYGDLEGGRKAMYSNGPRSDRSAAPPNGETPEGFRRVGFYVDGACHGNGQAGGGLMGAGVVRYCGESREEARYPLGLGTNQRAELLAVIEALRGEEDLEHAWVTVYSDSAYAVGVLYHGWKAKANLDLVEEARPLIRRCARFRMVQVKGHAGHRQNERADRLAALAVEVQK